MRPIVLTTVIALFIIRAVVSTALTCGGGTKCPMDTPCCSQYGECGTGSYCLGGCDPINSNTLNSCAPEPICKSNSFTDFESLSDFALNTKYLGNASASDWMYSGQPLVSDGNLLLTMAKDTVGTVLSYNHYIWYGRVSTKMKTSRDAGVVTAFILLSDVKDEIDVEFIGVDLRTAQLNYFYQGITGQHLEVNATIDSDSFENFHTYEVDWTPDAITWYVDGESVRTLLREDTYNATSGDYMFPQTPSRLEMSVWPGGLSTNAPGTIAWAGGEISWDTADIKDPGYYYATISEVNITCYDPPAGANSQGDKSYIYIDSAGTNNTVMITNEGTVLSSFEATGTNMTAGATVSSSATSGSDGVSSTSSGSSVTGFVQGNGSSQSGVTRLLKQCTSRVAVSATLITIFALSSI
ncbi:CAZyme family GH16 [Paecilomyces variotii]|nr:CAZyme family GH16 [Paecilomyces variotii]